MTPEPGQSTVLAAASNDVVAVVVVVVVAYVVADVALVLVIIIVVVAACLAFVSFKFIKLYLLRWRQLVKHTQMQQAAFNVLLLLLLLLYDKINAAFPRISSSCFLCPSSMCHVHIRTILRQLSTALRWHVNCNKRY